MVCSSGPISGVWQPLQAEREETLVALYHRSSSPRGDGDGDGEDASSSTDEHSPLLHEEKDASRRQQQQQPRSQSQLRSSSPAASSTTALPPPPQSGHREHAPAGVAADRRGEDDRWRLLVEASAASAWPCAAFWTAPARGGEATTALSACTRGLAMRMRT